MSDVTVLGLTYRNKELEAYLLELARYGNAEATEQLLTMHKGSINMVVNRYHRIDFALNEDERRSACHIAFWKAIDGFDSTRGASFSTYATKAMCRRVVREFRKSKRYRDRHCSIRMYTTDSGEAEHEDHPDTGDTCPQKQAGLKEQQTILGKLFDEISDTDRALLQRYHGVNGHQPHSIPELSRRYNLPPAQIKLRLKQALLKMRQAYPSLANEQ